MTIYNFKNRILISITKPQLKMISDELSMDINKLDEKINKILQTTHNSVIQEIEIWIDHNVPLLEGEDLIPTEIRDNIKDNLGSSRLYSRQYRIKLGTFFKHDLVALLNEDESKSSYQFMERMVDYACKRTHFHLENNITYYCADENSKEKLIKYLTVNCTKD